VAKSDARRQRFSEKGCLRKVTAIRGRRAVAEKVLLCHNKPAMRRRIPGDINGVYNIIGARH